MAAKLELTLKRIPWYLLLKGFGAGLVWLWLPFWLFGLTAIILYLVPLFEPTRLLIPFLFTLGIAFFLAPGILGAATVTLLMIFILGIKDLLFIERAAVYQVLVLLLLFVSFYIFFGANLSPHPGSALWGTLGLGILFFSLLSSFLRYEPPHKLLEAKRRHLLLGSMGGLFIWQLAWVILFLPLNFLHQTALLFLIATLILELFLGYARDSLSRRGMLSAFSVLFVFVVVILTLNEWRL